MASIGDSRSAGDTRRIRRLIAFHIASGAVLGLFGPYGSYQALALPQRVAFWILSVAAIGTVTIWNRRLAARLLEARIGFWPVLVVACIASSVIGAAMLGFALPVVMPSSASVVAPVSLFAQVLLVTVCLTGIGVALERHRPAAPPLAGNAAAAAASDREAAARWRQRLPAELRAAELLALEAEDHYLRVHTTAGSTLILMRLSDAIAELGADQGVQVHRSFWVSRTAVERAERDNGRISLILRGGLKVPVSRAHQGKIKAVGWA